MEFTHPLKSILMFPEKDPIALSYKTLTSKIVS